MRLALTARWATDVTAVPEDVPVKYLQRGVGTLGDVIGDEYNGVLISRRVADELRLLAGESIVTIPAVIAEPTGQMASDFHFLLRARHVTTIADRESLKSIAVAAIRASVDYIIVSDSARRRLELIGIPAAHFQEPLFAA